jgi:hypothetical protein
MNININGHSIEVEKIKLKLGDQEIHISDGGVVYGVHLLTMGKLIGLENVSEFPIDLIKGHLKDKK